MLVARLSPPFRTFRVLFAAAGVALVGYYLSAAALLSLLGLALTRETRHASLA